MSARLEATIHGRVQLVMFRDFTTRTARKLGIVGSVRNVPDGTVTVIAEGEREKLEGFLTHLRKGSLLSKVEHVDASWKEPSGAFTSFTITYD